MLTASTPAGVSILAKITQGGVEVMDVGLGTGFTFGNAGATDNEWARHAVLIDVLFTQ